MLRICPCCGKKFIWLPGSIFKIPGTAKHPTLHLCSYTCYAVTKKQYNYKNK